MVSSAISDCQSLPSNTFFNLLMVK